MQVTPFLLHMHSSGGILKVRQSHPRKSVSLTLRGFIRLRPRTSRRCAPLRLSRERARRAQCRVGARAKSALRLIYYRADEGIEIYGLALSPAGTRMLFRELGSGHTIVGIVDVEQAGRRYLAATLGNYSDPAFSHDGRAVAVIQFRDPPARFDDSRQSFWLVRVADLATGHVRTVWSAPEGEGGHY